MPDNIRIPYTDLRNVLGEVTPRPLLAVEFVYQGVSVRAEGLVDSGADINVLPYGIGTALGLDWGEQRYRLRLSGNLANFDTRVVVLAVKVAGFAAVDLAFAWTQAEQAPLIFGQTNFFQAFNICFFRSEAYFSVTIKDAPQSGD